MKVNDDRSKKFVSHRRKPRLLPHVVDLNDPASFRPLAMGAHAALLWSFASMQGWMTKYASAEAEKNPLIKTNQRRYVLLVDRMLYTFKTDNPQYDFREFFELTPDTAVSLTDQFPGRLYCIEIERKDDGRRTWYLEAENEQEFRLWLDRLTATVQWLRRRLPGVITPQILGAATTSSVVDSLPPSNNYFFHASINNNDTAFLSPKTSTSWNVLRRPRLPDVLPPQLPPPTSRPPPPPSSTFSR